MLFRKRDGLAKAGLSKDTERPSVLIVVENLSVPFDRRVWQEALALREAGCGVSVICPKSYGHSASHEVIDDIQIYRHPMPIDASGALGYLLEYSVALFWELVLSFRVRHRHGIDIIQACNPPDLIFLVALVHKVLFGTKFVFDHHDISPELFEVKFGRRGLLYKMLTFFERCTFRLADVSIATNSTFKRIAVERGGMDPNRVFVVKSYPDIERFHRLPANPDLKHNRPLLVGYIGIMAKQDGVDYLLRAMAHIIHERKRRDISCAIIGNGPDVDNLKRLARELDLDTYVDFTGYLAGDALLTYLSTIDVGVIPDPPNAYNDKISMNKVFEYMMLGIPFAQFDLSESKETAGEAAVVAERADGQALADAILTLADDERLRMKMAEFGRSRASAEFQWAREKLSLLAAYTAVTGEVARAPATESTGLRIHTET